MGMTLGLCRRLRIGFAAAVLGAVVLTGGALAQNNRNVPIRALTTADARQGAAEEHHHDREHEHPHRADAAEQAQPRREAQRCDREAGDAVDREPDHLPERVLRLTGGAGLAPAPGCDLDAVTAGLERWLTLRNPFDRMAALSSAEHCWLEADFDQRSGMPWVIVSDRVRARLVPLHGARVGDRRSRPLTTPEAVRRGIDWGTATLLVEPS